MGDGNDYSRISEAFTAYFKNVHWPADPGTPRGVISEAGWKIRYIIGRERSRAYVELYAMNRMTNDRHLKIYDDGTIETLEAVSEGLIFKSDVPGDRERAERDRKAKDAPLIADLKQKGLW